MSFVTPTASTGQFRAAHACISDVQDKGRKKKKTIAKLRVAQHGPFGTPFDPQNPPENFVWVPSLVARFALRLARRFRRSFARDFSCKRWISRPTFRNVFSAHASQRENGCIQGLRGLAAGGGQSWNPQELQKFRSHFMDLRLATVRLASDSNASCLAVASSEASH